MLTAPGTYDHIW